MVLLLWITLSLIVAIVTGAGHKDVSITCECTTSQCLQLDTPTCITEGLCFTQYLDRGIGSPSLVRGCIGGRTPLLCENRKPSKAKNWPLLHCCSTDLCNRGTVPTPPPWHGDMSKETDSLKTLDLSNMITNGTASESSHVTVSATESPQSSLILSVHKSPWPHIVSPVYVSVLVLGVVSLIIIGIVAATVIRRNNRFYTEHYGALEFQQPGKATHIHCDCDSEVESVGSSQPYLHIVCPNRNT